MAKEFISVNKINNKRTIFIKNKSSRHLLCKLYKKNALRDKFYRSHAVDELLKLLKFKLDKLERKTKLTNITNLSLVDEEFIYNVSGDIEHFIKQRHSSSVLLFPPVNNFRRFLIHQTCEQFRQQYDLFTFSVGQGPFRRTVVCFRNQLLDPNKFADTAAAANFESRKKSPAKSWRSERKSEGATNESTQTNTSLTVRQQKSILSRMGVEKNGSETRSNKTNSMDLYRPPALRNLNYNSAADTMVDTTTIPTTATSFIKSGSVNANAVGSSAATATAAATTTTSTAASRATVSKNAQLSSTTSISCNNSPTHANENNTTSFNNNNNNNTNNAVTSRCVNVNDCTAAEIATTPTLNAPKTNAESATAIGALPTPPVTPKTTTMSNSSSTVTSSSGSGSGSGQQRQTSAVRRERRPDRAVYIPRARRSQTTPPTTPTTTTAVTAVEVTTNGIACTAPTNSLNTPITPATAFNNNNKNNNSAPSADGGSSSNVGSASNQHQQLAIISESTASVYKTPSTKLDDIQSGHRGGSSSSSSTVNNTNTNTAVKKTKSTSSSSSSSSSATVQVVGSRERRERSKKSSAEVQEAKISKLSLDRDRERERERSETKIQQQQQQQQQNCHVLIAFNETHVNNRDSLYNQQQQQQQLLQQQQQQHNHLSQQQQQLNISENSHNNRISQFERQTSEENNKKQSIITEAATFINNEMNSNSVKRNKVKNNSNGTSAKSANKVHNLRIEDVASKENGIRMSTTTKCDIEAQEFQRASKEINRSNRRIIKQTFVSDVLEIPEKPDRGTAENDCGGDSIQRSTNNKLNNAPVSTTLNRSTMDSTTEEEEEEDDWENMFDDSGECLDPKIMQELTASVGKVKIELPKMDYTAYLTKQSILNDEEFPHVLEVSNFPTEFKNQDLLMLFSQYKESGFDIKWVDDTHALAVFSSSRIAAEVLAMGHPFVVLKPLAEATLESRLKAKKCAASLQPYRQRPETCAALARRLVTGALGVRLKTAAAERENEKRVLREAKERKMLAAKQRDEIWES